MGLLSYLNGFLNENVSKKALRLLTILVWTQFTLFKYIEVVFSKIPIFGALSGFLYYILILICLIFAWPLLKKRIKLTDILFYILIILLLLCSMVFFENNAIFIENRFINIVINVLPFYFFGLIFQFETSKNDIYIFSILSIIVSFMYLFYRIILKGEIIIDNMGEAYRLLPSILFVIYIAFKERKISNYIIMLFSLLLVLGFGTRGPILISVVFLLINILFDNRNNFKLNSLLTVILFLLVIIFLLGGVDYILLKIKSLFEDLGLSTRILDYFLAGNIVDDNGRKEIVEKVVESIFNNPLGIGVMGEHYLTGGYAHSLFLEIWCNYGIVLGSIILGLIFYVTVKALIISRKTKIFKIFVMFFCMVFIKLFLSGSYWDESWFFFLIGLSISVLRFKKRGVIFNENCTN